VCARVLLVSYAPWDKGDVLSALESGKGHQSIPHMGPPAEKMNPDLVGLNRPVLLAR
jgi:hypothetical protein